MFKFFCAALLLAAPAWASYGDSDECSTKEVVFNAVQTVLVERDTSNIEKYFDPGYIQHNPNFPDGLDVLFMVTEIPNFNYQVGLTAVEGDLGFVQALVTGFEVPMVVIDVFRVEDCRIVEHWDVLSPYVPVEETASGNPVFEAVEGALEL